MHLLALVATILLGLTAATTTTTTHSTSVPRPTSYTPYTFDQPIDHFPNSTRYAPHTNGTFKQRYVFDDTYYEPGGPVFLYIGGETSAESRYSNLQTGIIQILMQATNGLGVILENRYYGESYPFNTSTIDELAYLSQEQTIADNQYFAQHVQFPGIDADLTAPQTPWILYGGSLAGAQTAFSLVTYGNTLYGGIASSAPIIGKLAYPEWYYPIQLYAPQDCVASINAIIDKIDHLVANNAHSAINHLKRIFGLEALKDIRDFAQTIAFPIGGPFIYPTNTWQELNWNSTYGSEDFFNFCRNVTDINAPDNITAIDYELANYTNGEPWTNLGNYANYVKNVVLPLCPSGEYDSSACFGTQNRSFWADTSNSATRSYLYTTCVEQGAYQVAPASGPSLISRVLQVNYTQEWCEWAFPKGKYNSIPSTPDLNYWNRYGGFNISADRLAFIDGSSDVWNQLCYHSKDAPQRYSTNKHPELLINGAGHHWDSYGILDVDAEPQFIREAHYWEIRTVQKWLRDFKNWKA
ncbi:hypothetical protein DTO164E3_3366 [Paecilomyces variotii]|nr:hypothetical protein DTO164E3_3366 [Paecilomyces variotii]